MNLKLQTLFVNVFLLIALKSISQVEISFTQPITQNFIESELIQEVSFIPLQYEKIGSISPDMELRIDNNNFFILDDKFTQCVYRFDEEGILINTICETKKATQEDNPILNNPAKFNINPYLEQVEIFNFENSTLNRFSYNGKKIDQIVFTINPTDFTRDSDGNYWIYTGWNNKETQFRLLKTDQSGKIIDKKMRLPTKCTPIEGYAFSIYKSGIFLYELLGNHTYIISGNSLTGKFFLNYGPKNLPLNFHSLLASESYQFITHNGYYSLKKYLENDHFAYFFVNYISPEERNIFHIIFDKKTKKTFKYIENAAIGAFDKAQALTENDELIFLVSPRKIRQLTGNTSDLIPPVFNDLSEAANSIRNTMIVKFKLQSLEN